MWVDNVEYGLGYVYERESGWFSGVLGFTYVGVIFFSLCFFSFQIDQFWLKISIVYGILK